VANGTLLKLVDRFSPARCWSSVSASRSARPGSTWSTSPLTDAGVELLAVATLGLMLFSDAVRVGLARLRIDFSLPARMLALGLPPAIAAPCPPSSSSILHRPRSRRRS
jgi:hypothetical protein